MTTEDHADGKLRSTVAMRVLAAVATIWFLRWAESVIVTLLFSIGLSYLLDPFVGRLERWRVPRAAAALVVLLVTFAFLIGIGVAVWDRADRFAHDWPNYSGMLREAAADIYQRIERIETRLGEITPGGRGSGTSVVHVADDHPVGRILLRGIGSLYAILLEAVLIPVMSFFMLSSKRSLWYDTLHLFAPGERGRARDAAAGMSTMLRGYIAGNLLVAVILAVASGLFFWSIGLEYPLLLGAVSGFLNLVPYLGVGLALVPPVVVGLATFETLAPFVAMGVALTLFHMLAYNVLVPAMVGRKVHLNPLAVAMSLLFWSWLWGAIGLVLAIPLTAAIRVLCDHVAGLEAVGRWLSETSLSDTPEVGAAGTERSAG